MCRLGQVGLGSHISHMVYVGPNKGGLVKRLGVVTSITHSTCFGDFLMKKETCVADPIKPTKLKGAERNFERASSWVTITTGGEQEGG